MSNPLDDALQSVRKSSYFDSHFFLPADRAGWDGGEYKTGKDVAHRIPPNAHGVRFQEPDPTRADPARERHVQQDLKALVKSVRELRKTPALAGAVLSDKPLVGQDSSDRHCRRAIFGLLCADAFKSDVEAAGRCHQNILLAIKQAGFRLDPPHPFASGGGMKGLETWCEGVRLKRTSRFDRRWLLLLLLPLLLLCLLPLTCNPKPDKPLTFDEELMGMEASESFIIIVDVSPSMKKHFDKVRSEAKRLIGACRKRKGKCHANVISFADGADSALKGIKEIDDGNADELYRYLDNMKERPGTKLKSAIDVACDEIKRHGKPTTLLILTDGEDGSIKGMIADKDGIKQSLGGVGMKANTTHPDLFDGTRDPTPKGPYEQQLADFSRTFDGRFGPKAEKKNP